MASTMSVRAAPSAGLAKTRRASAKPARTSTVTNALRPRSKPFSRDLSEVLQQNKDWSDAVLREDPTFFEELNKGQAPQLLWIGCADSRAPPNQIMGLLPGEIFVHRNVGNQFMHTDMNCMSAMEYSVKALGVKHIIVCGHYNCGAVKGALTMDPSDGTVLITNCWITNIRDTRNRHQAELAQLDSDEQLARLCELNVMASTFSVATSSVVQEMWANGEEVHVHGMIFGLEDGKLKELVGPISSPEDLIKQGDVIQRYAMPVQA